jgi:hypothetical protein
MGDAGQAVHSRQFTVHSSQSESQHQHRYLGIFADSENGRRKTENADAPSTSPLRRTI